MVVGNIKRFRTNVKEGDYGVAYDLLMNDPTIVDFLRLGELRWYYMKSQKELSPEQVKGIEELFRERRPGVNLTSQ